MKTIRRARSAMAPFVVLALMACEDVAPADRVVVAVPVQPLAGLVEALAPDGVVEPLVLVPPGTNPASHQPSTDQLRRIASASAYLEVGHPAFPLERAWLDGLLAGSGARRVAVFADCVPLPDDPHVWTSPDCLRSAASRTAGLLAELLPDSRADIDANLVAFGARLSDLTSAAQESLGPHRGRSVFVLHPAWAYLLRDHGIEQVSILSHGTGAPGSGRLAELIERGRAERIRTVYVQPQFNPRPATLVAEELGAEVVSIDPLARDPAALIDDAVRALAEGLERETPHVE